MEFTIEEINNLMKIREYITKNYPDSCIAVNEPKTAPEDILKEVADFFKYEVLHICGCGVPYTTEVVIRDYLDALSIRSGDNPDWNGSKLRLNNAFGTDDVCSDPLLQFMAYTLDGLELTDHGTSISGAWLTELGEICLYVLNLDIKYEVLTEDDEYESNVEVKREDITEYKEDE